MDGPRYLIVTADDLGLSTGVNAGIVEAHEHGVVTSASLMVRRPAAAEAAKVARRLPSLAVGLHLEIAEWVYGDGKWQVAHAHCDANDPEAVGAECREQLAMFRSLLGRDPTHLDSHQHAHMSEPVGAVVSSLANELGVPLRGDRIRYEGAFYGQSATSEPWPQGIAVSRLVEIVEGLPAGWTELGCHPGIGIQAESSYGPEREVELRTLRDPRVREALDANGVQLRSFGQLG